jgi:hypothetical protein
MSLVISCWNIHDPACTGVVIQYQKEGLMRVLNAIYPCFLMLLLLTALTPTFLFSQPVIIDTLYTIDSLQVEALCYPGNPIYYMARVLPEYEESLYIGDTEFWDAGDMHWFQMGSRSLISFIVQPTPETYEIDNVILRLYQIGCCSDTGVYEFPMFWGQLYGCYTDHVDYGDTIEPLEYSTEPGDFAPPVLDVIGPISVSNSTGWKEVDITYAYQQDVETGRDFSQYLIAFPVVIDGDYYSDGVAFRSSYTESHEGIPQIVVTYHSTISIDDDVEAPNPIVSIYPNPCRNYVTMMAKDNSILTEAQLYNLKGQKVTTINTSNNKEFQLDIDQYITPGIYILKYTTLRQGKTKTGSRKLLVR